MGKSTVSEMIETIFKGKNNIILQKEKNYNQNDLDQSVTGMVFRNTRN